MTENLRIGIINSKDEIQSEVLRPQIHLDLNSTNNNKNNNENNNNILNENNIDKNNYDKKSIKSNVTKNRLYSNFRKENASISSKKKNIK